MNVTISFQSPDWSEANKRLVSFKDAGPEFQVTGFDLDHDVLTVYPRNEAPDVNLTLAVKALYMNEDGQDCGEIGWRIAPDLELLDYMPELQPHIGKRYGRVLVFSTERQ